MNTSLVKESLPELDRAAFTEWFDRRDGIRNAWTAWQAGVAFGRKDDPVSNKWWFEQGKAIAAPRVGVVPAPLGESAERGQSPWEHAMNTSPVKESLPELPKPFDCMTSVREDGTETTVSGYTTDQMREYGRQCALQAIAAPREGWQAIETAPKDAWVLVYGDTHRTNACAVVAMYEGPDDWRSADDGYGAYIRPTHWMPLPAAPLAVEATDSKESK